MNWLHNIWSFYYDGFRSMTLGKKLWLVIAIKLVIIFAVLKLFFFHDYIKEHSREGHEAEFVAERLTVNHPR